MFRTLNAVGLLLQVIGALIPIGGVLLAVLSASATITLSSNTSTLLFGSLCGSVIGGAIVFGFGGLLRAVVVIARNSEESADALIRMTRGGGNR